MSLDNTVERVTEMLTKIKSLESEITQLKKQNRDDKDVVIKYMLDNKKRFLGDLELKLWKGTYYLSLTSDIFKD